MPPKTGKKVLLRIKRKRSDESHETLYVVKRRPDVAGLLAGAVDRLQLSQPPPSQSSHTSQQPAQSSTTTSTTTSTTPTTTTPTTTTTAHAIARAIMAPASRAKPDHSQTPSLLGRKRRYRLVASVPTATPMDLSTEIINSSLEAAYSHRSKSPKTQGAKLHFCDVPLPGGQPRTREDDDQWVFDVYYECEQDDSAPDKTARTVFLDVNWTDQLGEDDGYVSDSSDSNCEGAAGNDYPDEDEAEWDDDEGTRVERFAPAEFLGFGLDADTMDDSCESDNDDFSMGREAQRDSNGEAREMRRMLRRHRGHELSSDDDDVYD